jgi:hypothetical protein
VKEVMKANARYLAQFQNVMDLVKAIKAGEEHLAQLQNQMAVTEEGMKVEGEYRVQIQKDINSRKMVVEIWVSVLREQMAGDPASLESSIKMRTPRKLYTVASNAAAEEKKKVMISKTLVHLVPLPNGKAAI